MVKLKVLKIKEKLTQKTLASQTKKHPKQSGKLKEKEYEKSGFLQFQFLSFGDGLAEE